MKSVFKQIIGVGFAAMLLTSCSSTMFVVGTGASKSTVTSKKQWYALWGLVRLNKVKPKVLAGEASNYTVKKEFSFGDIITNTFTSIISLERETITIIK